MDTTKGITIGRNRGNGRVWLEGSWLTVAGFTKGSRFNCAIDGRTITLQLQADGPRKVSGKLKAGVDVPIIDMNGSQLTTLIGKAVVTIGHGRLVIVANAIATSLQEVA